MNCPLCASGDHFLLQRTEGLLPDDRIVRATLAAAGDVLRFHMCRRCELIFRTPRPSGAALDEYYKNVLPQREPEIMREMGVTREQGDERNRRRYEALYREVSARRTRGRVIDIGGWDGAALVPWTRAGWNATLVDPGARSRKLASSNITAFESPSEVPASADVLTSYHCIEHLLDLRAWLDDVRRLSRRKTLWVIEVPIEIVYVRGLLGRKPLREAGIHEEHLNFFTPDSLGAVARAAGLRVRSVGFVITLYWFGPTVALRMYAEDDGAAKPRQAPSPKSELRLRAKLAVMLPFWRRVAGLKFRAHRAMHGD